MKKMLVTIMLFIFAISLNAQEMRIEKPNLTGINTLQSPLWGSDVVISNFEPCGPVAAIRASNGTIYVAVNDTLATTNLGLIIFQSTNNGNTWTLYSTGLTLRARYDKLKLISAGGAADSIYLFEQCGSQVYCWNFRNLSLNVAGFGYTMSTFDVVGANNGALYYFYDTIPTGVRRYSSLDGGTTWINRGSISSAGVKPRICISAGDSLILNYLGPVLPDTATSVIRAARYMQTAPGILASSGFQDVALETVAKNEYMTSVYNGNVWFLYTSGTTGAINIKGRKSIDGGVTYATAVDIAANPNIDEYWFDLKYYSDGFYLSYYSDSLQSGPSTNNSDKVIYSNALLSAVNFSPGTQISQKPPVWSIGNYKPALCVLPGTDVGIVWVGLDGTNKRVYWDRYSAITSIGGNETPAKYNLSQNYPNPFNPVTKINFEIPKSGFVSLKVYDLLGKEVRTLVSEVKKEGRYQVEFAAGNLSSGVYFYRINSNSFTDTKQMILIK
ncbi:MAG: T9SS type A sorting domain-containing protein [Ignavibacteriae bacterium]|nr:T9SS type A sorting domain-containing protein [Ignavibacteriota bacterium]